MDQSDDRTFLRKFGGIIIGLMMITVIIIFVARSYQNEPGADANPSQQILAEERISPVSGVRVGDEGAAALAQVQPAEEQIVDAQTDNVPAAAESGAEAIDGGQVYNSLCMTCHDAGVAGAPVTGSEQMAQRVSEKGLDTLVANAINGINVMPPKGGNLSLSDEEIRAAVEFMLN
jgi:cytochrome c5